MYLSSITNFSPITIWTLISSHLKRESSGLPAILKKEQLYSPEILLATQNTGCSYVTFTKFQHQKVLTICIGSPLRGEKVELLFLGISNKHDLVHETVHSISIEIDLQSPNSLGTLF